MSRIPKNVSVVDCDNIAVTEHFLPTLTTVDRPPLPFQSSHPRSRAVHRLAGVVEDDHHFLDGPETLGFPRFVRSPVSDEISA